jgi:hypothetical protein
MKKYLVLIGAAVLVLALVSPSMAQFKSWGHLEVQTVWVTKPDLNTGGPTPLNTALLMAQQNPAGGNPPANSDLSTKQVFERFRFYLQYGDPKTVRAVLGFEADSFDFGERSFTPGQVTAGAGYTYGYPPPAGGFTRMGSVGTDTQQLKIMHAFLEFVIPTTPVKVAVGLQPYNVGGVLFLSKDVPGITVTADFAPHKVELFWYRERDANTLSYGVDDVYGAQWTMAQKMYKVYAYGFYKNDLTGGAGINDTTAGSNNNLESFYDDHPWWLAIGGEYRPGNWEFQGQFVYNGGKRENKGVIPDQDYNAWQGIISGRYRIGPGLSAAVEGFYSTGNDGGDASKIKRFTLPISSKWGNPSEVLWGMGADRSVFYFFNWDLNYVSGHTLDYSGCYFGRLNVEFNPVPWVNLNFNWLYIGDTSTGSAADVLAGRGPINSPNGARQDSDKSYICQELDVIAKIKIYEPLYYNIGLGYFFPGDVFDNYNGNGRTADNGWALNTKLIYVF